MPSFLEEFLRNPATVGSMVPSSRELTGKVMGPIDFASARCIVEYGPGTGVFTDILMQRCKPETGIVLIEVNLLFNQMLKERCAGQPNGHVIHGPAGQTGEHLKNGEYLKNLGLDNVDYVVCGLPFSSLPRRLRWRILQHTRRLLLPEGKLAFQHSFASSMTRMCC